MRLIDADALLDCISNPYERAQVARWVNKQPEIIRCKDCKYRMPYDWMFSEIWRSQNICDYSEDEIGCQYCDMAMKAKDFCSRGKRQEE